jgi:hypothetical protein
LRFRGVKGIIGKWITIVKLTFYRFSRQLAGEKSDKTLTMGKKGEKKLDNMP